MRCDGSVRGALVAAGVLLTLACTLPSPITAERVTSPFEGALIGGVALRLEDPPQPLLDRANRALGSMLSDALAAHRVPIEAEERASARLVVRLVQWRERSGGAAGSTYPARVAFELTLDALDDGRRLWSLRVDETQKPLTENLLRAFVYPAAGLRWLTAEELARWASGVAVDALVAHR